jgi:hypothetical protein
MYADIRWLVFVLGCVAVEMAAREYGIAGFVVAAIIATVIYMLLTKPTSH